MAAKVADYRCGAMLTQIGANSRTILETFESSNPGHIYLPLCPDAISTYWRSLQHRRDPGGHEVDPAGGGGEFLVYQTQQVLEPAA